MKNKKRHRLQQQLRRFYFDTHPSKEFYKYCLCTKETFQKHINNLMLPKMTKENYGSVWEFDHIVPVDLFDFDDIKDLQLCYSRYNTIPIYSRDNKLKGASVHFSYELLQFQLQKDLDNEVLKQLLERCYKAMKELDIYFK